MKIAQVGVTAAMTIAGVSSAYAGGVPALGVGLSVSAGTALPFGIGGMAVIGALALIAGGQLIKRRNK
jgi:hypothetical protein